MFRLTQPNVSSFVSISTPGSWVEADPLAVVPHPGSSILSSGLSRGLRVVAEPVSAVLPWVSSCCFPDGFHRIVADILVDSSSYYRHMHFLTFGLYAVKCIISSIYTRHLLHVCPSWERDPSSVALPEVSPMFPLNCGFSLEVFPCTMWGSKDRGEGVVFLILIFWTICAVVFAVKCLYCRLFLLYVQHFGSTKNRL